MKRLKVIACEIAFRELCYCASQVSTIVDFVFMTKGLHDKGAEGMRTMLQEEIDMIALPFSLDLRRDILSFLNKIRDLMYIHLAGLNEI